MPDEVKQEITQEVKKDVSVQSQHINMVADLSNGVFGTSDTFKLACQMAKGLASSTMVPQQFQRNEGNCLVAIELANRLNISPFQVMQSIDVIQGQPAWKGKTLIAFVNNSHKYDEDIHFEYTKDEKGNVNGCYAWTKKDGHEVRGTEYTYEMAKKAKLFEKNNSYWNKEPELMLAYRAISRFCSLNCPEISLGLYTSEEQIEIADSNKPKSSKASLNELLQEDVEVETVDVESEVVE